MLAPDDLAVFADCPLAHGLDAAQRADVLGAATSRSLTRGQTLFGEGEPAEALFVVAAGRLRLTQATADGRDVIVRLVSVGEPFAAIAALDGRTYPFSAVATAPSRVCAWARPVLRALFARLPCVQANVLDVIGRHARESLDRLRELSTEPVPRRLARALCRLLPTPTGATGAAGAAIVIGGVTQQELADLCATTLFTVSRTLSAWEARGIVSASRGRLLVRDRARLDALAEGRDAEGTLRALP